MSHWTSLHIPDQRDRTAIVTGTGGLGLEDSLALAAAGARVIIAGRDPRKGKLAVGFVNGKVAGAQVGFEQLDLADLSSVEQFARRMEQQLSGLDLLINNAAVMTPPDRQTTQDGFELQLGTNYLGHFALTAHLMPLLRQGNRSRVVTLSSVAARTGVLNFEDLQAERDYQPMPVYGQSKLACLMFALELQRRSDIAGWDVSSIAAHPGISRTDLLPNGAGPRSAAGLARKYLWFLFQPAAQGALPTLYAATCPEARGGEYYGPNMLGETRGYPRAAKIPRQALDTAASARLWKVSEELTGVSFG